MDFWKQISREAWKSSLHHQFWHPGIVHLPCLCPRGQQDLDFECLGEKYKTGVELKGKKKLKTHKTVSVQQQIVVSSSGEAVVQKEIQRTESDLLFFLLGSDPAAFSRQAKDNKRWPKTSNSVPYYSKTCTTLLRFQTQKSKTNKGNYPHISSKLGKKSSRESFL